MQARPEGNLLLIWGNTCVAPNERARSVVLIIYYINRIIYMSGYTVQINYNKILEGGALDSPPPKFFTMEFTISPPKHDYTSLSYSLIAYFYLKPLFEVAPGHRTPYDIEAYGEFSDDGRLHFHGTLSGPTECFAYAYKFMSHLEEVYKRANPKYKIKGLTTRGHKFTKNISFRCMALFRREPQLDPKGWEAYITKDVLRTKRIMGPYVYESAGHVTTASFDLLKFKIETHFNIV